MIRLSGNLRKNADVSAMVCSLLIKFRKEHPSLGRPEFLSAGDITWHEDNWLDPESRFLAFTLHDRYVLETPSRFSAKRYLDPLACKCTCICKEHLDLYRRAFTASGHQQTKRPLCKLFIACPQPVHHNCQWHASVTWPGLVMICIWLPTTLRWE